MYEYLRPAVVALAHMPTISGYADMVMWMSTLVGT